MSTTDSPVQKVREKHPEWDEERVLKAAWKATKGDADRRMSIAKSTTEGSVTSASFEVKTRGAIDSVFKSEDDTVIWGPASVEVVDKENDRITADALEDALPQLLKRKRLSYEHQDQIVGDILERFKTDEPRTVVINGKSITRKEFPTEVMKLDGMKPGLFVAGRLYNDTQKSQDVQEMVKSGEIDSYSISGEAVVTEMSVKDGQTFTDIVKMDLSAVTLCREGMNQKAKFDVVSKDAASEGPVGPVHAAKLAKQRIEDKMSDNTDEFIKALESTLDKRLPDGELATKGDVEEMVDARLERTEEGSPMDGGNEQPDGNGSTTTSDPQYEGDMDEVGASAVDDPDKVEETKSDTYSTDELKSLLPDDQFKAIEPLLERGDDPMMEDPMMDEEIEDEEPDIEPMEEEPPEMGEEPEPPEMPEEDEMEDEEPVMASKALNALDVDKLTDKQTRALLKAQQVQKASGVSKTARSVGTGAEPAHSGTSNSSGNVVKADSEAISSDPALRKVYDENGDPQL